MSTDKAKPIQERIAGLFGRTSHPAEGAGGTSPAAIRTSDVAAALGVVSRDLGRISALVLETHYGSTLVHERELSKAWEVQANSSQRDVHRIVLTRFAGALAIRQVAGATYTSTMYAEYAYLLFSRREELQRRVDDARGWMMGLHDGALGLFRRQLWDHAIEREHRRALKSGA